MHIEFKYELDLLNMHKSKFLFEVRVMKFVKVSLISLIIISLTCIMVSIRIFGAENQTKKVACIGDSITSGMGSTSYPVYLGKLLGKNFEVNNYGIISTTLLKKGDNPYWKQNSYTASKGWLPDIVLIMLGTNDSKSYNWINKNDFVSDYTELINSYKNLTSKPVVYVMTSPTVFKEGAYGITNEVVTNQIVPLTKEVAKKNNCPLIDINLATKKMQSFFPDNIHPNDKGSEAIAKEIYNILSLK